MSGKLKKPKAPEAEKFPRKAVMPPDLTDDDSIEEAMRKVSVLVTSPELAAYRLINATEKKSGLGDLIDVPALMEQLRQQAAVVNRGDLSQAEAMLMNQATALQSLFARLAERGMGCDQAPAFEANMRMALRAQSQCRATLETLAAIKNPPTVYAHQANVTSGPQQINNGMVAPASAPENENQQNKLMEAPNGQWLDTGTARATSGTDKAMATVGKVDRA